LKKKSASPKKEGKRALRPLKEKKPRLWCSGKSVGDKEKKILDKTRVRSLEDSPTKRPMTEARVRGGRGEGAERAALGGDRQPWGLVTVGKRKNLVVGEEGEESV